MWVPVPPSSHAALAGATVLANISGSPITIARAEDRRQLVRSASSRCSAAYAYAAGGEGESSTDLSWDGQTMVYECGQLLGEGERFPEGRAAHGRRRRPRADPAGAHAAGHLRRQPAGGGLRGRFVEVGFTLDPPSGDIGLRRKVDRFPFVPDDVERLALDCFEAYNIQVSGLEQRLRAIGQPKVVIGVSGGLDSTHALIVAAKAMDRLDRPRSDILALHPPRLRHRRHHEVLRHPALQGAGLQLRGDRHPAGRQADAHRHGAPLRQWRGGLRRHLRERAGRAAHRLPVPDGQPARRDRARHRRPVRAGARLVHVRRRRPDVALHRQLRSAEDPDPAPDPLGGRQRAVRSAGRRDRGAAHRDRGRRRSPRSWSRPARARRRRRPRARSVPMHSTTSRSSTSSGSASGRARSPSSHATPGRTPRWASGHPTTRRRAVRSTTLGDIRGWLEVFVKRFFASQFKRSALPNGPKVSAGGTMSPRGDWRMPSDAGPAAWLAELENVPRG